MSVDFSRVLEFSGNSESFHVRRVHGEIVYHDLCSIFKCIRYVLDTIISGFVILLERVSFFLLVCLCHVGEASK